MAQSVDFTAAGRRLYDRFHAFLPRKHSAVERCSSPTPQMTARTALLLCASVSEARVAEWRQF